ncbi:hypothetical protein B0H14DRAFT_1219494 [Mycena olivaceomarginata]|nr:hypothetical protein B0H14DRAFT_1219494 [Mycena olivaceomarginata]
MQHSEQHELVRTGRCARSQHGGYLANGGEGRGARHGGGVYIHSTSSALDIGASTTSTRPPPPTPLRHRTRARGPRRCGARTARASSPSATSRRSPPSRRPSILAPASHSHGQGRDTRRARVTRPRPRGTPRRRTCPRIRRRATRARSSRTRAARAVRVGRGDGRSAGRRGARAMRGGGVC